MSSRNWLVLKLVIVGDSDVGKTSLFNQYGFRKFTNSYQVTVGTDFLSREVVIDDDKVVTLQLWDTAGQERFQSLGGSFYRRADACMLVFDVTRQSTFRDLDAWRADFLLQASPRDPKGFPFVLVGNKVDLTQSRKVASQEASQWAQANFNMPYFECSAKEATNVEAAFMRLARDALARKLALEEDEEPVSGPHAMQLSTEGRDTEEQGTSCYC